MSRFDLNDENQINEDMKLINVSSLQVNKDLDLQSYWLLRKDEEYLRNFFKKKFDKVNYVNTFFDAFESKIYLQDILGHFSEKNSVTVGSIYLGNIYYSLNFSFNGWKDDYPLRFDPFDGMGEGEIIRIQLINKKSKKIEITYQGEDLYHMVHPINDINLDNINIKSHLIFKAIGDDPYFYINIGNNTKNGIKYELQIISSITIKDKKAFSNQLLFSVDSPD